MKRHLTFVLLVTLCMAACPLCFGSLGAVTTYADTTYSTINQDISAKTSNERIIVEEFGNPDANHQITVQENVKGVTLELNLYNWNVNWDSSGTEHSCIYLKRGSEATVIINGDLTMKGGHHRGAGADKGYAAIAVNKDAALTLIVRGNVAAYGGDGGENRGAAAIGGGDDEDSGTMNIIVEDGGELYCEGADGAAAIGGGDGYSANKPINITTEGNGKLTAKATSRNGAGGGAGIGGGDGGSTNNTIDIEMSGSSTVNAEGINGGAGVGAGRGRGCGKISVRMSIDGDGNIPCLDAKGGDGGAGIGGGSGGSTGDISISGGGNIIATGGFSAADIGGGSGASCGKIAIMGDGNQQTVTPSDIREGNLEDNSFALSIMARTSQDNKSSHEYSSPNIGGKTTGDITVENADIYFTYPAYAEMYGASIGCGRDGKVGNITVRNSRLLQDSLRYGDYICYGAMVGEGAGGAVSTIDLDTVWCHGRTVGGNIWSSSGDIETININNSYVYAEAIDATYYADEVVKPYYLSPIAGIGSGYGRSVKGIFITDSEIHASGKNGGAGIGGSGVPEVIKKNYTTRTGDITISGSEIDAAGDLGGAGIGSGICNSSGGSIFIRNSEVSATGGENGAGIGNGWGTPQDSGKQIYIDSSKVTAAGGKYAAGIGGCNNDKYGKGGDISNILISGDSVVEASGGEEAAGIGGGSQGKLNGCTFELTEELSGSDPLYYVKATGNAGAAGIGSGASNTEDASKAADASNITVKSGYIYAKGGEDKEITVGNSAFWIGTGAGIGGGGRGGLKNFTMTGGVVKAEYAGCTVIQGHEAQTREACGIGHGGGYAPWATTSPDCSNIVISGGTVDGTVCTDAQKYASYKSAVKTAKARTVTLKSAKAKKGRKALLYFRNTKGVSGYQIFWSTSSKFSKKTVKSKEFKRSAVTKSNISKTISKLRSGKTYYFKIRTYTDVRNPLTGKNEKVYGKWSKVKKARIK